MVRDTAYVIANVAVRGKGVAAVWVDTTMPLVPIGASGVAFQSNSPSVTW